MFNFPSNMNSKVPIISTLVFLVFFLFKKILRWSPNNLEVQSTRFSCSFLESS